MPKPKNQRKAPKSQTAEVALRVTARPKVTEITSTKKAQSESKQDRLVSMLRSPTGATMMSVTGWQQHSVRGFLAGVVRKRLKLKLASESNDGNRIYRIMDAGIVKPGTEQTKRRAR